MSHPMWVRGLKLGCHLDMRKQLLVAPHVGAWIETIIRLDVQSLCWSHPMWVRGLKLVLNLCKLLRSLVAPHVGAWIETFFI